MNPIKGRAEEEITVKARNFNAMVAGFVSEKLSLPNAAMLARQCEERMVEKPFDSVSLVTGDEELRGWLDADPNSWSAEPARYSRDGDYDSQKLTLHTLTSQGWQVLEQPLRDSLAMRHVTPRILEGKVVLWSFCSVDGPEREDFREESLLVLLPAALVFQCARRAREAAAEAATYLARGISLTLEAVDQGIRLDRPRRVRRPNQQ